MISYLISRKRLLNIKYVGKDTETAHELYLAYFFGEIPTAFVNAFR